MLVVVLFLLAASSAQASPKISNGVDAPQGKFPQTVSLQYQREHICGATILNENWAMTAAACISGPSFHLFAEIFSGTVDLKGADGTYHNLSEIVVHEDFSFFPEMRNDIAVIRVIPPFDFSDSTKAAPVLLPAAGYDAQPGSSGSIAGWGQPTPNLMMMQFMQETEYKTVADSDSACSGLLNEPQNTMCGANDDVGTGNCYGDNGGPFLVDNVQLGIISWVNACDGMGQPTVFTQISSYIDWINTIIN